MSPNQLPSEKTTPSIENAKPNYLEWYRVTADCLSKIIVPIIVLSLLLFYNEKIKGLFDEIIKQVPNIEEAKIGNLAVIFAKQNARITELQQQVDALNNASPLSIQKDFHKKNQQINQRFKENSEYTVLVFYRDARFRYATEIVNNLLDNGFSSFASSTDLTELPGSDNTIRILYTNKGRNRIEKVEEIIRKLIDEKKINGNVELKNKSSLEHGDIQILLY